MHDCLAVVQTVLRNIASELYWTEDDVTRTANKIAEHMTDCDVDAIHRAIRNHVVARRNWLNFHAEGIALRKKIDGPAFKRWTDLEYAEASSAVESARHRQRVWRNSQ